MDFFFFNQFCSGTYNNQWIILDYKLFNSGNPISPNTLWISESMPGKTMARDVSSVLTTKGYWASYNIPYFPEMFNYSGCSSYQQQYGNYFSYCQTPRAKIFARDQSRVSNIDGLKFLMQYNDYQHDPFSDGYPCFGISARSDLMKGHIPNQPTQFFNPTDAGGIDTKLTNKLLAKNVTMHAIAGPTHQGQPPFQWSTSPFSNHSHVGQPDTFSFDWNVFVGPQ